jgi:hypothetical protein
MMNLLTRYLRFLILLLFLGFGAKFSYSQQENTTSGNFKLYSTGLSVGWYNPAIDYWKDESEFKDADFKGAIDANAFLNMKIIPDIYAQLGLGYWQESVAYDLQGFGNTTLLLTGIPISLDFKYHITPFKFSVVTPFVGAGGEFLFLQNKMVFDLNDDPEPQWGKTMMGRFIAGFETKLSAQFAVDFEFQYKLGNYKQDFKIENPDNPDDTKIITETISLNGPKLAITLKYLL